MKELCKSDPDLEEFMTAIDSMVRSDCFLVDSCRRVVYRPSDNVEEVDFIVVGGGVAGKKKQVSVKVSSVHFVCARVENVLACR